MKKIQEEIATKYSKLLGIRKFQKQRLNILDISPEGGEKEYMFREQRKAEEAEAERWEKKKSEERQRQLQEKYQQLKQDQEQ